MAQIRYEHLLVDRRNDGVGLVTFNRPEKLNAFSSRTRRELISALGELGADPSIGSVVLTGGGDRAFAAGQDLAEAQQYSAEVAATWVSEWMAAYDAIIDLDKPTVAAVNGYAVGAAFQMAVLCDLRIAADGARFGMAEIDDGIPCIAGAWILWDLIGRGRTADMILSGRMIDAREALAWGVVSRLVPGVELMEAALALGRTLAAKPRTAMRLDKEWLRQLLKANYEKGTEFARYAHTEAFGSGEPQHHMASFLARRRQGRST